MVLVERDSVYLHGHRRHHIWRFLVHDKGVERLDIYLFVAHYVSGDELTAAIRKIERLNGCILDTLELADDRLHFFEFNTKTADLDLSVLTAYKLDGSVLTVTDDIARAVATETIPFYESLRRLIGVVEVADTYLRSGDVEFACSPPRHAVTVFIDDEKLRRVVRKTDWDIGFVLLHEITACIDRALCRSVSVLEPVGRRIDAHQFLTTGTKEFQ